jgi:hypothetical protein
MMMGRLSRTEELKPNIKYDLIVSTCNTSLLAEIQDQPTELKKKNSMIILSTSVRILLRDPLDQSHYLALPHQDPIHCIEHISKQGISITLFILPLRGTVLPHRTMFPSLRRTVLPSAYGVHQAFFV